MFNKLKQFKDLRSQAKTLQNALAGESIEVEKSGVKININGNLEITNIKIEDGLSTEKIESATKDAMNDGIKKMQRVMAKKMQEMGGLPGLM